MFVGQFTSNMLRTIGIVLIDLVLISSVLSYNKSLTLPGKDSIFIGFALLDLAVIAIGIGDLSIFQRLCVCVIFVRFCVLALKKNKQ